MTARSRETYTNREVLAVNQDPLGAGADLVATLAPGLEVWSKPVGSRTGGTYALMLLNATAQSAPMQVSWSQLNLENGPKVRDLWLYRAVPGTSKGYQAEVPAHSAILLEVSGRPSWKNALYFEAEWPGVDRLGNAELLVCGECSRGYAMALGGEWRAGGLRFSKIEMERGGAYTLRFLYVRNGLENKQIGIVVNGEAKQVNAIMRSWNWIDVPIRLRAGENAITVSYDGERPFYLDNLSLQPAGVLQ